jgi:hypothetical protein
LNTSIDAVKDRRRLAELLLAIEQEFDVNAIRLDGVHLWPFVRLAIGRVFKASDPIADAGYGKLSAGKDGAGLPSPTVGGFFPANKQQRTALKARHRDSFASGQHDCRTLLNAQWKKADELRATDFVVLSKVEKYYETVGERRYSPILDPVVEDLHERGRVAVLGLEPIPFACVNEPVRIDDEPYAATVPESRRSPPTEITKQLHAISEFVRRNEAAYSFNPKSVLQRYYRVAHRAGFFAGLFERIAPRCILMSSFSGWQPAVLGARRVGIPTIDIQHGGQGPMHHPTAPFSKLPVDGYETMPDVFWLWGRRNLEYTGRWLPGAARRHIPVVGGNRKVARWFKRRDSGRLTDRDKAYLDRFTGRPVVLVTLGYGMDRLLPEPLVEAMRAVAEADWHVRLHPIHRNRETAEQIHVYLKEQGCRTFFVEEPTEVQLPTALSVSFAHITPLSTAGMEAVSMGVPTLVCHRVGASLFADDIHAQVFDFADEAAGIAAWTRAKLSGGPASITDRRRYVEIDDSAIDDVLRVALSLPRRSSLTGRIRSLVTGAFS